jgi:hypothetical protein
MQVIKSVFGYEIAFSCHENGFREDVQHLYFRVNRNPAVNISGCKIG